MKGIYTIINLVNGNQYVGSTNNIYQRKAKHFSELKLNRHHSNYLQNAWNKYGEENFKFIILEIIEDENILIEREQFWIDTVNSKYNINKKATSCLGTKRSKETRKKLSEIRIKGIKEGTIIPGFKDKRHTSKSKEKISISQKRKSRSKEHTEKIKQSKLKNNSIYSRPILQFTKDNILIEEYKSITQASLECKIGITSIANCLSGISKTSGGFIWLYKN